MLFTNQIFRDFVFIAPAHRGNNAQFYKWKEHARLRHRLYANDS